MMGLGYDRDKVKDKVKAKDWHELDVSGVEFKISNIISYHKQFS